MSVPNDDSLKNLVINVKNVEITDVIVFSLLTFNTEFFLSRSFDNEYTISSKRHVINLVSLFFLISSTSKSLLIR